MSIRCLDMHTRIECERMSRPSKVWIKIAREDLLDIEITSVFGKDTLH